MARPHCLALQSPAHRACPEEQIQRSFAQKVPEGKAQADPDLVPLLDKIGAELKASGARVRIEGRTEISEPGAGWALAAERAAWVADRWIQKGGWEASRIAVVSLGGVSAPPGQAGSEAERALQRRVDIRVLPEK